MKKFKGEQKKKKNAQLPKLYWIELSIRNLSSTDEL